MKSFCGVLAGLAMSLAALAIAFADTGKKDAPPPKVALAPDTGDLTGIYSCEGSEVGGKKYSGVVTIQRHSDVYVVSWLVGNTSFIGVGLRSEDKLSVGWAQPSEKGVLRGVNVYAIAAGKEGPRLNGRWVNLPGNGQRNSENLTWLKHLPAEDE